MKITFSFERHKPFAELPGASDAIVDEYCAILKERLQEAFPEHSFVVVAVDGKPGDVEFDIADEDVDRSLVAFEIRRIALQTADEVFASWANRKDMS